MRLTSLVVIELLLPFPLRASLIADDEALIVLTIALAGTVNSNVAAHCIAADTPPLERTKYLR